MNLQRLKELVKPEFNITGSFKVYIKYRNVEYSCISHNFRAYNRISHSYKFSDSTCFYGYTLKQAYLVLYKECKQLNDLK